jgi:hypothetical protein
LTALATVVTFALGCTPGSEGDGASVEQTTSALSGGHQLGWRVIPNGWGSGPAVVSQGAQAPFCPMSVFVVGTDLRVYNNFITSPDNCKTWTSSQGWQRVGLASDYFTTGVAAVGYIANDIHNQQTANTALAAIDPFGQVTVNVNTNNGFGLTWLGWSALPTAPAGVYNFWGVGIAQMNNTIFVVAEGGDGTLWFNQNTLTYNGYSASGWTTWRQVSTSQVISGPAVVANRNNGGTLIIAAQLASDSKHHTITGSAAGGGLTFSGWSSNSPWTQTSYYGNGPALSITPDGQLNYFAAWASSSWQGYVINFTSTDNGAHWSGGTLFPPDVRDTPAATSPDASHFYVIGIGTDGAPYLNPYLVP